MVIKREDGRYYKPCPDNFDIKAIPKTRFQGSKRKYLPFIKSVFDKIDGTNYIDLFSGTGTVSLLLRLMNKNVLSNDILSYNANSARLFVESVTYSEFSSAEIDSILNTKQNKYTKVQELYNNIFFNDYENMQIDNFCFNIGEYPVDKQVLFRYALGQALIMKRPYNLFHRANLHMRTKDVKRSFGNAKTWETPIEFHMKKTLDEFKKISSTIINRPAGEVLNSDYKSFLSAFSGHVDVIYLDPPYAASNDRAIDYFDFYGFLDVIINYDNIYKCDLQKPHKPIVNHHTKINNSFSVMKMIDHVIKKFPSSIIVLSYRSDGKPTLDEICEIFKRSGRTHETHREPAKYALSHKNSSEEIIIISAP